jgi:hypothetical protein
MGRGLTDQLEGTKQMVTQPVATAQALIEAARQVGTDPRIILEMLRAARQKAMSGALGLGELIGGNVPLGVRGAPVMREIDVYHGSPHRFPPTENNPLGEFDASKIGTGEGAQAYGHGTYLAESPNVAKSYAIMDSPFAVAGLKGPAATVAALAKIDGQGNPVKFLEDNYESQVKKFGKQDVDAAIASLKRGNLYTADLPDEMVDRMLDWDKPLSEQSPSVLAALEKSKNKQIRAMLEYAKTPYTGAGIEGETKTMGEAYRTMSMNLSGRASAESAKASNLLQQAGIPGIRYLDAGSRLQGGSGTRNFVVFPGEEKKVKILKRE